MVQLTTSRFNHLMSIPKSQRKWYNKRGYRRRQIGGKRKSKRKYFQNGGIFGLRSLTKKVTGKEPARLKWI